MVLPKIFVLLDSCMGVSACIHIDQLALAISFSRINVNLLFYCFRTQRQTMKWIYTPISFP